MVGYTGVFAESRFSDGCKLPHWSEQEVLIKNYGLGSGDAAILNMAESIDNLHGILTNDSDMIEIYNNALKGSKLQCVCYTFLTRYVDRYKSAA